MVQSLARAAKTVFIGQPRLPPTQARSQNPRRWSRWAILTAPWVWHEASGGLLHSLPLHEHHPTSPWDNTHQNPQDPGPFHQPAKFRVCDSTSYKGSGWQDLWGTQWAPWRYGSERKAQASSWSWSAAAEQRHSLRALASQH